MKSEKEFLESMWAAIEQEQSDTIQEQMVLERNKRENKRKAIVILIITVCVIAAFVMTKIYNVSIPEEIVYVSSFILIIVAFVLEKLSFKEVHNGN